MKKTVAQPKPQKNMWAVIFSKGTIAYWTIAYTKKQAIDNYYQNTDWIKDKKADWKERLKKGVRCVKINITFQIVEK